MRIAIDMDEVLADTLARVLEWLGQQYGHSLTPKALIGYGLEDLIPPEHYQALEERMQEPDFFADLPVMTGSQGVVRDLSEHHEVFVATAAMEYPGSFAAKFNWLAEHFPFIAAKHIVFCGDKSILSADFLIDDNERHFDGFNGQGLLFTAPHNVQASLYPRVNNWEEVRRIFLQGSGH